MTQIPATKKLLVPDVRPAEDAPTAEIRVAPDVLEVLVANPNLEPRDAEVVVTPFTLRMRRRGDERMLVYALPVAAEAGRFVLRCKNGVYTILIARAQKSR
ncbi:MAG: hypothetical protein HYT80_09765 [Euryarchaeota archaeon]|nr:hypothetical protein [Euryarchaeota archaeon]